MQDFSAYRDKRDFPMAPEPRPRQKAPQTKDPRLVFVVQRHQASHLHYDFRLEVRGVLKSWAVPKGPSLDSHAKRLAIQTEDHPYDYKDFEGEISEGTYGAGSVIVWDRGWYEPVGAGAGPNDRMMRGLRRGAVRFILYGKKLRGGFSLILYRKPDQWLLTKQDDIHAMTEHKDTAAHPLNPSERRGKLSWD